MGTTKKQQPTLRDCYYTQKPSQVVKHFLDWLEDMRDEQEKAWNVVITEDSKVQDFLHEIELEPSSKKRSPIDTRFHNSRVKRRAAKDKAQCLKPIKDFVADATNRGFIKRLKKLQGDLKAEEDFVSSERVYKPRVNGDSNGNNN